MEDVKIFSTLSINFAGGQLSLGRSVEAADPLDTAITQLETGVLLLSSIRYGDMSRFKLVKSTIFKN